MNPRVLQIRTDALSAEYIYSKKLGQLSVLNTTINVLSIILPILITACLLILKGGEYESIANNSSIAISAILLSLVVFANIIHINTKNESYLIGRRSNIYVGNEALKILNKTDSELEWFYNYLVEMDSKDKENIGNASLKLRQAAYRDSLKRLHPGLNNTTCSICGASPFVYKKGDCQVCGNTPTRK